MDLKEKRLYHQIHPVKLFTDISVTPISLFFLWERRPWAALVTAFVPPLLVSYLMLMWFRESDLEKIRVSPAGRYVKRYMTPLIEALRMLTLLPMAYGAWQHKTWSILLGIFILIVAWANGFLFPHERQGRAC